MPTISSPRNSQNIAGLSSDRVGQPEEQRGVAVALALANCERARQARIAAVASKHQTTS